LSRGPEIPGPLDYDWLDQWANDVSLLCIGPTFDKVSSGKPYDSGLIY
jgi:hypothetical protein